MSVEVGQIIKNIVPNEAVKITKIQPLGAMKSISYVGINSKKENTKVIDEQTFNALDDFDEFDDNERESLENILSDPRKFKLFTTAKSPQEIREETNQVKELVDLAENLYKSNIEEQKLRKLRELFQSQGVLDKNEKIVIFTEHKDTLDYLSERLKNSGYSIETIHGGKSVDERQQVQTRLAGPVQILIATDAAGEGINLQFCRLLINWDIPWNTNRLSQLGDSAWLYIVIHCKSTPMLYRIRNPGKYLHFEIKSKGIQYFLDMNEWKKRRKKHDFFD